MFKKTDKNKLIDGANGMGRNVLVVDDEDLIRQIISIILKSAGYKVIEAVSGNDALSKMTDRDFGLVITDLRMPGMDGIEFIKQLRSESSTQVRSDNYADIRIFGLQKKGSRNSRCQRLDCKAFYSSTVIAVSKKIHGQQGFLYKTANWQQHENA